ncbi:dihydrodipicolinate reductase [Halobacteroides halobius DSM 5150]|uniref:4-hydroxy-tetrahydrodipicolinate reductase n=1 Tax=Halobacteroides halobius (strain ATCC 35273 / DSM 5150 / MD-1) TaxID=748449 RepID=L0K5Y7_HALHC|nr:4-hydroxy-tetrahydrodipicolinate reductase [Halobacteroides halobius]AGB40692.1 dihydrodipicolinate reductase [Halobacteroides halobius DSM 5150]
MKTSIVVSGANGRMGQAVVEMISEVDDFKLVGAVDVTEVGKDIHQLLGLDEDPVKITENLAETLEEVKPDVVVEFTNPQVVMEHIQTTLEYNIDIVIGTTGITEADLTKIEEWNQDKSKIVIAPNFAIGAILMMNFAQKAAKFMDDVEIIELHHDNKIDAPSGTAIKTAELIGKNLDKPDKEVEEIEKLEGARGGLQDKINIHSVRLPGLVAHQEVIFGGEGQTLSLKHDSINRKSFMPGVELAIKKLVDIDGVVYGLENLIDL